MKLPCANHCNFLRTIHLVVAIILAAMITQVPSTLFGGQVLIPTTADARIGTSLFGPNGTSSYLAVFVATNPSLNNTQRTVLQFDLSALGANAVITNATLKLWADANLRAYGNPNGLPMEVYRITQPWAETVVTWYARTNGASWAFPGGDFVGSTGQPNQMPYATNSKVVPDDYYTLSPLELDWNVTSLVKEWYAGTQPNYGLILLSYPSNGLHLRSRENITNIPLLEVDTAPPPPSRPVITATQTNGTVLLNWDAIAGRTYQLQYRTNLTQPDWNNFPNTITATGVTAGASDSSGISTERFYRVVLLP